MLGRSQRADCWQTVGIQCSYCGRKTPQRAYCIEIIFLNVVRCKWMSKGELYRIHQRKGMAMNRKLKTTHAVQTQDEHRLTAYCIHHRQTNRLMYTETYQFQNYFLSLTAADLHALFDLEFFYEGKRDLLHLYLCHNLRCESNSI